MDEKTARRIEFAKLLEKSKLVSRANLRTDGVPENDAEHSWHMAVLALMFRDMAGVPLDMEKVLSMIAVHDIVEIGAGDTYAYDAAANIGKAEREKRAADEIFGSFPDGEKLRALWEEFEACETAEARYAASMDRLQPLINNDLNGGKVWKKNGIKAEQAFRRNAIVKESYPAIYEIAEEIILRNKREGNLL